VPLEIIVIQLPIIDIALNRWRGGPLNILKIGSIELMLQKFCSFLWISFKIGLSILKEMIAQ